MNPKYDQRKVWEGLAVPWKKNRHKPWKEVIDFLRRRKGLILDIGCGSGRNFITGKEYFGIDMSKGMLKYAKEDAEQRRIRSVLARASAESLPIKDGCFDTALYVAALHTIRGRRNRKKSLLELGRVMKRGGHAIITVWNRQQPRFEKVKRESYVPWKYKGKTYCRYYYLYDRAELKDLLNSLGFKVEKIFLSESKVFNVFPKNIIAIVKKP